MNSGPELPLYQSRKRVRALKIKAFEVRDIDGGWTYIVPADPEFGAFRPSAKFWDAYHGWRDKDRLGYYVLSDEGVESWLSANEFEKDYSPPLIAQDKGAE